MTTLSEDEQCLALTCAALKDRHVYVFQQPTEKHVAWLNIFEEYDKQHPKVPDSAMYGPPLRPLSGAGEAQLLQQQQQQDDDEEEEEETPEIKPPVPERFIVIDGDETTFKAGSVKLLEDGRVEMVREDTDAVIAVDMRKVARDTAGPIAKKYAATGIRTSLKALKLVANLNDDGLAAVVGTSRSAINSFIADGYSPVAQCKLAANTSVWYDLIKAAGEATPDKLITINGSSEAHIKGKGGFRKTDGGNGKAAGRKAGSSAFEGVCSELSEVCELKLAELCTNAATPREIQFKESIATSISTTAWLLIASVMESTDDGPMAKADTRRAFAMEPDAFKSGCVSYVGTWWKSPRAKAIKGEHGLLQMRKKQRTD